MKLYDCRTAPSPRRVRIFLAEKGLDVDTQQVDLRAGEQLGEAFRRINPDCTVPVLELDDGRRISEVIAICDYLENVHPAPALIGSAPAERAEVLMWNARLEQQGLAAIAEALRNTAKGLAGRALTGPDGCEQIPELAARGRQRAQAFFGRLDAHLGGREFVAGERFSMADITALVAVDFAAWVKLPLDPALANLARWHAAVSARDSARA